MPITHRNAVSGYQAGGPGVHANSRQPALGHADDPTGTLLANRYHVQSLIGQGSMGKVYLGEDRLTGRTVAIKMLNWRLLSDPRSLKRFDREARATGLLSHPNIISVYDVALSAERQPYLVTEFVDGGNLSEILKSGKRLDVVQIIRVSLQVCAALAHAHFKGVIHRDLKPSNIMVLRRSSEHLTIKVVDFGVAKLCKSDEDSDTTHLTKTDEVIGTPAYMSPEQCLSRPLDARSDIYSLGVVMYHLISGKSPLLGNNTLETMGKQVMEIPASFVSIGIEGIPFELEAIIFKCLRKTPDERFQTMEEVANDLRKLLSKLDMVGWARNSDPAVELLSGIESHPVQKSCFPGEVDSRARCTRRVEEFAVEEARFEDSKPKVRPPVIPVSSSMRSYDERVDTVFVPHGGDEERRLPVKAISIGLAVILIAFLMAIAGVNLLSDRSRAGSKPSAMVAPDTVAPAAAHHERASAPVTSPSQEDEKTALKTVQPSRSALASAPLKSMNQKAKTSPSISPDTKGLSAKIAKREPEAVMFHSVRDGATAIVHRVAPLFAEQNGNNYASSPAPPQESISHDPTEDVVGLNNDGVSAMSQGNYPQAIRSFERALKVDPGYRKATINLCNCYHNYALELQSNGRIQESEQMYKRSLALRERTFGSNCNELVPTLESYAGLLRGAFREDEARAVEHKLYSIKGH